jgi:hypothetical protein
MVAFKGDHPTSESGQTASISAGITQGSELVGPMHTVNYFCDGR